MPIKPRHYIGTDFTIEHPTSRHDIIEFIEERVDAISNGLASKDMLDKVRLFSDMTMTVLNCKWRDELLSVVDFREALEEKCNDCLATFAEHHTQQGIISYDARLRQTMRNVGWIPDCDTARK